MLGKVTSDSSSEREGDIHIRIKSLSMGIGLIDQALISASSFGSILIVARSVSVKDFGVFSLILSVLFFTAGIQNALISSPHAVFASPHRGRFFGEFTTAAALFQLLLSGALLLVLFVLAIALGTVSELGAQALSLGALACAVSQLQEFCRRVLYAANRQADALTNDLISFGLQPVILAILWLQDQLTLAVAIAVIGLTSAMGALLGAWQIRGFLIRRFDLPQILQIGLRMWTYGRWLLGGNCASWLSGYVYPIGVASYIGLEATAGLAAIQTLLGPLNIILRFIETTLTPLASRAFHVDHVQGLTRLLRRTLSYAIPILFVFCLGVYLIGATISGLILGSAYLRYSWLILPLSIGFALNLVNSIGTLGLRAMAASRPIFIANISSAIFALTIGIAGIITFGLTGVAGAVITQGVLLVGITWQSFRTSMAVAVSLEHSLIHTNSSKES
jgi:O-antigen/teichoic acid export membrane protein